MLFCNICGICFSPGSYCIVFKTWSYYASRTCFPDHVINWSIWRKKNCTLQLQAWVAEELKLKSLGRTWNITGEYTSPMGHFIKLLFLIFFFYYVGRLIHHIITAHSIAIQDLNAYTSYLKSVCKNRYTAPFSCQRLFKRKWLCLTHRKSRSRREFSWSRLQFEFQQRKVRQSVSESQTLLTQKSVCC